MENKIKVMNKQTVKQQLVDRMLRNGNDFTYTEVIKTILKIRRGEDYEYTRDDRGHYSTNMSPYHNGYLVNGGGKCGLYKNANGRWSAKYWTIEDKIKIKAVNLLRIFSNQIIASTMEYNYSKLENSIKKERFCRSMDLAKERAINRLVSIIK
jgi:hypothetical protein